MLAKNAGGAYLPTIDGSYVPLESEMISQKAKYALRALVALAESGSDPVATADIAERESIPKKFLEQILLELKRDGLVKSRRGPSGGYSLLKPAGMITFGQVLRLIDGPIAPLPCLSRIAYRRCDDCHDEATCRVRHVFAEVAESARGVLDHTTIADAIASTKARQELATLDAA